MELGAQEVTGLSREFLSDKSNSPKSWTSSRFHSRRRTDNPQRKFRYRVLNYELSLVGQHLGKMIDHASVLDTLAMARERFPGQRNSLDALCKRLDVNNNHRTLHGALLDAELLSDVYLSMTAGQGDLGLSNIETSVYVASIHDGPQVPTSNKVLLASIEEQGLHLARLEKIAKKSGGRLQWPS